MPTVGAYSRYTGGGGFIPLVSAPPFSPLTLSGLVAWYKADSGVTESGGAVSQWDDQSGNGWHVSQGIGSKQPAYSATGFNSRPGITFDGSEDYLVQSGVTAFSGQTNISGFLVGIRNGNGTNFPRWISLLRNSQANDYDNAESCIPLCQVGSGSNVANTRNNANYNQTSITTSTSYRLGGIFEPSQVTLYINNVATGPVAEAGGTFGSPTSLFVGAGFEGGVTDYAAVTIAEIVLTRSALSSTERQNLDDYFRSRWGL